MTELDYRMGAWVLAQLLKGSPVNNVDLDQLPEPYGPLATALRDRRNGQGAQEIFDAELSLLSRAIADQVKAAVLATDPMRPAPQYKPLPSDADVPDLSEAARLPASAERAQADAGKWLTRYCQYAGQVSPRTPSIFHESAGLWAGALAIARRLCLKLPHGDILSNLYILWVAQTTVCAKSTGIRVLSNLVDEAIPHLLLSNEFTPEALLCELAGKEPTGLKDETEKTRNLWIAGRDFAAQRGIILDEASTLFAGFKRDYLAGLAEMILRLYDAPLLYRRHTRSSGFVVAQSASLSFIGATTPARLRGAEIAVAWQDGLLARFGLLTPEEQPKWMQSDDILKPPAELSDTLRRLANELLPVPAWPTLPAVRNVAIDSEAFAAWRRYDKALTFDLLTGTSKPDDRLWGSYGRLPTQALKIALILAAFDWSTGDAREPRITLAHWARAQRIAEKWRASAHRLLSIQDREGGENGLEDRVVGLIVKAGADGLTAREIYRFLHSTRNQIEPLLAGLDRDGLVKRFKPASGKVERYCLVSQENHAV